MHVIYSLPPAQPPTSLMSGLKILRAKCWEDVDEEEDEVECFCGEVEGWFCNKDVDDFDLGGNEEDQGE